MICTDFKVTDSLTVRIPALYLATNLVFVKKALFACLFFLFFSSVVYAQDSLLRTDKRYLIAYVFVRLDGTTARVRIDNGSVVTTLKNEKNYNLIFPSPAAVLNYIAEFGWELHLSEHNRNAADDAFIYYFRKKE